MTPLELLDKLREAGIILTVTGDKLHVDAPVGAISPAWRDALLEQKLELIALLTKPDSSKPKEQAPFRLTIDELAEGKLTRMGYQVVGGDPDLYRSPWNPTIYVRRL